MATKPCSICKQECPLEGFYKRDATRYRSECKECFRKIMRPRSKAHYRANKKYYLTRNKRALKVASDYIRQAKTGKICTDCKQPHPFYRLHFDHLPGTEKRFDVSMGAPFGLGAVKKEIAKCELVCANCHADRTYLRSQRAR